MFGSSKTFGNGLHFKNVMNPILETFFAQDYHQTEIFNLVKNSISFACLF